MEAKPSMIRTSTEKYIQRPGVKGDKQAPLLIIDILTEAEQPESQASPESSKHTLLYHNGKRLYKKPKSTV